MLNWIIIIINDNNNNIDDDGDDEEDNKNPFLLLENKIKNDGPTNERTNELGYNKKKAFRDS